MTQGEHPLFSAVFDDNVLREAHKCFHVFAIDCAKFASDFARSANRNVQVLASPKLLYETSLSAYIDIARFKHFHFQDPKNNKSDAVKRAAYFTKWIVRLRPIIVIDQERLEDPPPAEDPLALLNEDLAIQWSALCIAQDHGRKDLFLRTKFHSDFIYYLRMREVTTDGLLMAYEFLHKSAADGSDNVFMEFPLV